MDVRLARPMDAAIVLALALDDRAHLVRTPESCGLRPTLEALARSILPLAFKERMWIASNGADVAILEARPRKYVIGWDMTRLAARGDAETVVAAVVGEAMQHLLRRGIPRLFARCSVDVQDHLFALGFRPLGREHILIGRGGNLDDADELPVGSRYRMPQDAWPLHQLENAVTPPMVRQLEGLTSLEWTQDDAKGMSEIVVERDGQAVGWIGWGGRAGPGTRHLGLMVHPNHRELAPVLLRHVLAQAGPGTVFQVRIRDYQLELLSAFQEAGFQSVGEKTLMVRHGGVVPARVRPRMRVAPAPSIQAFPFGSGISQARSDIVVAGPLKDHHP